MLTLLFNPSYQLLGGIPTSEGALDGKALVFHDDEELLKLHRMDWEWHGISLRREFVPTLDDASSNFVIGKEKISIDDPRFLEALHDWAQIRGYSAIDLDSTMLPQLKTILRLPLVDKERFAFINALSATSPEERVEWEKVLLTARQKTES